MPKKSKNREWEKERRERLNNAFISLSKLLPCYDPSRTFSKYDILHQATILIEELQAKVKDLLNVDHAKTNEQLEIKRLTERLKKLLTRNDQLCVLLKDAGIKIPKEYGQIKHLTHKFRWSNKITPEQAKILVKKEPQKVNGNEEKKESQKRKPVKKHVTALKSQKHQRKFRKKTENKKLLNSKQNLHVQVPLLNSISGRNITLGPNYMITNPSINLMNTGTIAKSDVFPNAIPSADKTKTLPKSISDKVLNILGPGTLILANGSVVPILPQPPKILSATILTQTANVIVNPSNQIKTTTTSKVIVTSKSENTNFLMSDNISGLSKSINASNITVGGKTLPPLRPKRCITRTTQVNKVPIPALTSRYAGLNIIKQECEKKKASVVSSGNKQDSKINTINKENKDYSKKLIQKPAISENPEIEIISNNIFSTGKRKCDDEESNTPNKQPKTDKDIENVSKDLPLQKNNKIECKIGNGNSNISSCTTDEYKIEPIKTNAKIDLDTSKNTKSVKQDSLNDEPRNTLKESSSTGTVSLIDTNEDDKNNDKRTPLLSTENDDKIDVCTSHKNIEDVNTSINNTTENCLNQICNNQQVISDADQSDNSNGHQPVTSVINQLDSSSTNQLDSSNINQLNSSNINQLNSSNTNQLNTSNGNHLDKFNVNEDTKIQSSKSFEEINGTVEEQDIQKNLKNKAQLNSEKKTDLGCNLHSEITVLKPIDDSSKIQNLDQSKNTEESNRALELGASLYHSELSNDIFSSLQVPLGSQNQESTSPTAAFLLAFPLVSTLTGVKVTEVIDEDNSDSHHGTPTLLQIGTMDSTKTTQTVPSESLTPSLLNLDNFSFFSTKDVCSGFYPSFDNLTYTSCQNTMTYSSFSTISTISSTSAVPITNTIKNLQQAKEDLNEKILQKGKQSNKEKAATESEYQITLKNPNSAIKNSVESNTSICSIPISNANTLSSCSSHITNLNNSVTYSTSYQSFTCNNDSKCKSKLDTLTKQNSNAISSSYLQENFNQVPYSTISDLSLSSSKPHTSSTTTSVISNINCNFTEKKFSDQKSQVNYNSNSASMSSMQCNTFNPFADKLPTDYNVSFARTYGNTSYINNNSNYSNAYHNENNSYSHTYTSIKSVSKANTDSYSNQQNYNSECNNSDISKCDSNNHVHSGNNNYYPQNGIHHKEKIAIPASKNVKPGSQSQPKPPINWMTTPDLKQDSTFSNVHFGKDFDYTNHFYPSGSFTSRSSHTSCFSTNQPNYQTPEFHNTSANNRRVTEGNFSILPHNSVQRNEFDENQFSWSPTKLPQFFDSSHTFVSSTLPTLVGDLALGTTQPSIVNEQTKIQADKDLNKTKDGERRAKSQNYDSNNQSNFLSVSQLVEKQNDGVPARTSRKNSGSRSGKSTLPHKSSRRSQKQTETKECGERVARNYNHNKIDMSNGRHENLKVSNQRNQNLNYVPENSATWFDYSKNQRQESNKNSQSIYSAEALLGHQISQNNVIFRQQHTNFPANTKSLPIPNFLPDNIMPYFSTVELQDNSFMQQNQNFQSTALVHNFSNTVQSYSYLSNNHITSSSNISSSYLPSSSFISDLNNHDYSSSAQNNILSQNSTKVFGDKPKQNLVVPSTNNRPVIQHIGNSDCAISSSVNKKSKLKQNTENSLPGLVDFSFLSMPGAIGSPMLPDDFHVHTNFLPPPPTPNQLYSCKNPPYSKQPPELTSTMISLPPLVGSRSQVQNIETPPNMSSIGNSLTNFNLSTIFPEINKVPFQNKQGANYGIPVPHTKANS